MTENTNWWQILEAVSAVATAIGVGVAALQLRLQKAQQRTDFEDRLTERYRDIMAQLPLEALLQDREPDENCRREALQTFYRYFDLSNEQIFLFKHGRISPDAWETWKEGIQENLRRSAFCEAWGVIAAAMPDSFDELRELVPPPPLPATAASLTPKPHPISHEVSSGTTRTRET